MNNGALVGSDDSPFFVIFTDLDATLLDHVTYEWKKAESALKACKQKKIPVVMVSSKTRAEMDILRQELDFSSPFIFENGGGIFFPDNCPVSPPAEAIREEPGFRWPLGPSYERLTYVLQQIKKELGWDIRGFSEMDIGEISRLTGLDPEQARLAGMRDYDEPFILEPQNNSRIQSLVDKAERWGLKISRGGRFFHIHGKYDKGDAVRKLITWYGEAHGPIFSAALGDSPNDFTMLKQVDQPVLIRSNMDFPGIRQELPGLIIPQATGPEGWNTAVLEILEKKADGGLSRYV